MVDREIKIRALLANQEEERRNLFIKEDFKDKLKELTGRNDWSVMLHKDCNWISIGSSTGSGYGKKNPDLKDVLKISLKLKTIPTVLVKDSCTSIKPKELIDEHDKNIKKISPIHIRVCAFHSTHTAEFMWYTKVLGKECRVMIYTDLNYDSPIGRFYIRRQEFIGGYRIADTKFNERIDSLYRDGEEITSDVKKLKWYSSPESPNDYTLYWEPKGSYVATATDVINTLELVTV